LELYKPEIDDCYLMLHERGFQDPTVLVLDCRYQRSRKLAESFLSRGMFSFPTPQELLDHHIRELSAQGKVPVFICGDEWSRDVEDALCRSSPQLQEALEVRGGKPLAGFQIMIFSGNGFLYTVQDLPATNPSKEVIAA
jgi:hypothetical protein